MSLIVCASAVLIGCSDTDNSEEHAHTAAEHSADAGSTAEADKPAAAGSKAAKPEAADAQANSSAGNGEWCSARNVFRSACTTCHNEKKVAGAPMSLMTHEDFLAPAPSDPAKKVYELVKTRVHDTKRPMPPQGQLTAAQLGAIDSWVDKGAKAGDDPDCSSEAAPVGAAAAALEWPSDCEATYKLLSHAADSDSTGFTVEPESEIHPQVSIPAPWGDEEVQVIAWRAITDNAQVLHHWILYGSSREFLVGWAPGKEGAVMEKDVGMLMKGGKLTLDMHYNNLGGKSAQPDRSGVELCVVKKDHFRKNSATVATGLGSFLINIPAKTKDANVTGTCTVSGDEPVTLLSASPHAHQTAHHMKFTLERASGEKIVMHDRDFNFEEQGLYDLKEPLVVNKGDKIVTTCTYDNDTDKTITFGENTGNEMCFNFALYYPAGGLKCERGALPMRN